MSWIVGKWYRAHAHYIKFERIENCNDYNKVFGEVINGRSKDYGIIGYWANDRFEYEALNLGPLEDLTEIQEYLPEGHVDRFDSCVANYDYSYLIELFKQLKIN